MTSKTIQDRPMGECIITTVDFSELRRIAVAKFQFEKLMSSKTRSYVGLKEAAERIDLCVKQKNQPLTS